ncbi:MAG: cation transporter [Deltaproteobacteria bacterium]
MSEERHRVIRRGRWLAYATLGYNGLEALVALAAGVVASSVALIGFGLDSLIELTASLAGLWRLHADVDPRRRTVVERRALRLVGACFLALAGYVAYEATTALLAHAAPARSLVGIALAVASLAVMPLLAGAKRKVAARLQSSALTAEARQTEICAYLSAILLAGLGLNAVLGWWWADSVAALTMAPLIAWEGWQGIHARTPCATCEDPLGAA